MKLKEIFRKQGFRQFLLKIIIFAVLFILGPLIVNTILLYKLKFFIYGGLGKVFLFVTIAFILLARDKLYNLKEYKFGNIAFGILSFILVAIFYYLGVFISNNFNFVLNNY